MYTLNRAARQAGGRNTSDTSQKIREACAASRKQHSQLSGRRPRRAGERERGHLAVKRQAREGTGGAAGVAVCVGVGAEGAVQGPASSGFLLLLLRATLSKPNDKYPQAYSASSPAAADDAKFHTRTGHHNRRTKKTNKGGQRRHRQQPRPEEEFWSSSSESPSP